MSTQRDLSISLATGQVFLQEKCQRWVQARLQGLRRAMFWGWQQAAARRRPVVASPEQLLLQRWVGLGVGVRGSSPPQKQQGECLGMGGWVASAARDTGQAGDRASRQQGHEGRPQPGVKTTKLPFSMLFRRWGIVSP